MPHSAWRKSEITKKLHQFLGNGTSYEFNLNFISWDPLITKVPGEELWTYAPYTIWLAHELIHAYQANVLQWPSPDAPEVPDKRRWQMYMEYTCIGLVPGIPYTENMLRAEWQALRGYTDPRVGSGTILPVRRTSYASTVLGPCPSS
jgi:hypothetical protein